MQRLKRMIGGEHEMSDIVRALHGAVREVGAPVVGAMHITCADESEHECWDAFMRGFARDALPRLKYGEHVPFRLANPGARYEWGSVRIAEDHFATQEARDDWKLMVVKLNGHVATSRSGPEGVRFGTLQRYDTDSAYCGAMAALLAGSSLPFAFDIADAMRSECRDRLASLLAMETPDNRRMLYAALCSARLQARRCVLDIQDHVSAGPTMYLVLHGVTLNRPGQDTEILGGYYVLDHRGAARRERYVGLGDAPSLYELTEEYGRLHVRDPDYDQERPARDHRALAVARLRGLAPTARELGAAARAHLEALRQAKPDAGALGHVALRGLLAALAETAPLATGLVLVAEGVAAIHHAPQLHRAVDAHLQDDLARRVVASVQARLDALSPDAARRVIDALQEHFVPMAG